MIDSDHRTIRASVSELVRSTTTDVQRAVRIHDFVRDEIRFGWQPVFYEARAGEVLRARIGYCNTKSTLMVAMLRAAGIPARQHFIDLDAALLRGIVQTGTAHVDHSFTEL